ncbi:MAG: VWA domain-containing protein [Firmicutes bacterium]|nr:VWA domain-containing protein [Bacillota bacterium]
MKKKLLSLVIVSIALLMLLGAGLQDPALAGAAGEEPAESEAGAPLDSQSEEPDASETKESGEPDGPVEPVEDPGPDLFYPAVPMRLFSAPQLSGTPIEPDANDNFEPWGVPGSLKLDKKAVPVEGKPNQWLVTLTLEGKDLEVETTSDIVLVIDTSGSMKGTRMSAAINAAKAFVNTLLKEGDDSTRIAVVSFATDAKVHNESSPFKGYSGKNSLLSTIDGLKADGGTFTQAGLRKARLLLENSSTADNKNIVLLSDGEPTFSYPIVSVNNKLDEDHFSNMGQSGTRGIIIWSPVYDYHARDDLGEAEYNYNGTAGGGSSITTLIKTIETGSALGGTRIYHDYYYHHGHSAIAESGFAWADNITVYSVGLYAGVNGQDILNRIAPDRSYEATEEDLEAIFQDIAGSITKIAAARNCTVIDPLGDMFSIIPGGSPDIMVNRGTAVYDPSSRTITWSDFTVREGHPATMSYIVQIHDNALSGVLYPTNRPTYINYTNVLGDPATKDFPIPQAGIEAAGSIKITKTVQNDDSSGKRFPIYVVREADGRTWSALLADGETATITGLGVGTYSINEVVPMGYEFISISASSVSFTVENPSAEFAITVANKKVDEPWFRDDDEKTNTFRLAGNW